MEGNDYAKVWAVVGAILVLLSVVWGMVAWHNIDANSKVKIQQIVTEKN